MLTKLQPAWLWSRGGRWIKDIQGDRGKFVLMWNGEHKCWKKVDLPTDEGVKTDLSKGYIESYTHKYIDLLKE